MARALRALTLLAAIAAVTACSVKETKAPPLSGPSELGLALTLQATPDLLPQDGVSQSQIIVLARDGNGQPVRNVTCRIDITVDNKLADFGMLSSRTVTTGSDGRASVTYTAPPASPAAGAPNTVVLMVTPIGTDYANDFARTVNVRLVPAGVINPPGSVPAYFAFSPAEPVEGDPISFSVSFCSGTTNNGCTPSGGTDFSWDFGDGAKASGTAVVHSFGSAGAYSVTLTITDGHGWPSSTTLPVIVKAGLAPVAALTVTPASPKVLQDAIVDASASTAAAGRRIVSYFWNFGDGTTKTTSVPYSNHDWIAAGNYPVSVTVTDDAGKTGLKMVVVTVTP